VTGGEFVRQGERRCIVDSIDPYGAGVTMCGRPLVTNDDYRPDQALPVCKKCSTADKVP
jgi:hypothetical protein